MFAPLATRLKGLDPGAGDRRPARHLQRGARGEKLARRHLRREGYKILYRNFRGRTGGEIDIVCRDGETLVFVEVKTRSSEDFGRPFETIRQRTTPPHLARCAGLAAYAR